MQKFDIEAFRAQVDNFKGGIIPLTTEQVKTLLSHIPQDNPKKEAK